MLRIKVCGFTRSADVRAAVALGIDFIGVNLAQGPRRVSVARGAELAAACGPLAQAVALFVNAAPQRVIADCAAIGCHIAQLHGDESPAEVSALVRRVAVIKALRVRDGADLARAHAYAAAGASALLLDAFVPGVVGGSGHSWDHGLLQDQYFPCPVFIAGGLSPHNVAAVAALPNVQGVDLASGVESAPGIKCPRAMAALVAALRGGADPCRGGNP